MPNPNINRRTQYPSGSAISAAAQAALNDWVTRVQGQGSDVTGAGTQTAVGIFIDGLMTDGVWDKIKRMNIYAGDGLNALKAPLKNTVGAATDTLANFVSGDYSQSVGLTGDGTTKYVNTGFLLSASGLISSSIHYSVYIRTKNTAAVMIMGVGDNAAQTTWLLVTHAGDFSYWDCNDQTTSRASGADSVGLGHYIASRTSAILSIIYRDGTSIATGTGSGGTLSSNPIVVHGFNFAGTPGGFTVRPLEMYSIGDGLTSTEAADFTSRYATLRAALGR